MVGSPHAGHQRRSLRASLIALILDVVSFRHGLRDDNSDYERESRPFPKDAGSAGGHVPIGGELLRERYGLAFGQDPYSTVGCLWRRTSTAQGQRRRSLPATGAGALPDDCAGVGVPALLHVVIEYLLARCGERLAVLGCTEAPCHARHGTRRCEMGRHMAASLSALDFQRAGRLADPSQENLEVLP